MPLLRDGRDADAEEKVGSGSWDRRIGDEKTRACEVFAFVYWKKPSFQ